MILLLEKQLSLEEVIKEAKNLTKECEWLKHNCCDSQIEEDPVFEALITQLRSMGLDTYTEIISPNNTIPRTWGREEDTYSYFLFKITDPFSTGWGSVDFYDQILKQSEITGDYLFEMKLVPAKVPDFLKKNVEEDTIMHVLNNHKEELKKGMQEELELCLFMYDSQAKVQDIKTEKDFLHINIELRHNNTVRYANAVETAMQFLLKSCMYVKLFKLIYTI